MPLPEDIGDDSFEPPDRSWGAQVTRITVNLFLFDVNRSPQPPRAPSQRTTPDGQVERRPPLPLVQVSYLITAWAGNTTDEHQLLGDVLRCLISTPVLPPTDLASPIGGTVQLSLADRTSRSLGDLWSALDTRPKPAFQLDVTAALDAPWGIAATPVERIETAVSQAGNPPSSQRAGQDGTAAAGGTGLRAYRTVPAAAGVEPDVGVPVLRRRRVGRSVVTESSADSSAVAQPKAASSDEEA
jgi:hypothetical protein